MRRPLNPIVLGRPTVALSLVWAALSVWPWDPAAARSLVFFANAPGAHDYAHQVALPPTFGGGELTLELWIKPDASFPVGPTGGGPEQLTNWSDADNRPYSSDGWWFDGNFLLDGHNNLAFEAGTFSLQLYGGGRLRWLFGDGESAGPGGHWSIGAFPASAAPSLLDGAWHHVALVRRWTGTSGADLELWIDGAKVATETTPARTDMRTYWDDWSSFPTAQQGWFWGAEKQAAIGEIPQYEDYKGWLDELRFWGIALSADQIRANGTRPVGEDEPGLVGLFRFDDGGEESCDALSSGRCLDLTAMAPGFLSSENAPLAPPLCVPGPQTLCLNGQRFAVSAEWETAAGEIGTAGVEPLTPDSGYLWFFDPSNVEVVVKVIDACQGWDRFWVFAAGLTNVAVRLRVEDTLRGFDHVYESPLGQAFPPLQDVATFATCP